MSSYQYRKSHCGDKTVVRSSYLHNGISYTSKMVSFYWISPWSLGDVDAILNGIPFSILCYWLVSSSLDNALRWMPHDLLMISQHLFRQWLGAIRQQVIAWANIDPDTCLPLASLCDKVLTILHPFQGVSITGNVKYIYNFYHFPILRWHR